MKRYRIFGMDFDTRANILTMEINESWAIDVKKLNQESKGNVEEGLKQEYGVIDGETKKRNFIDLGVKPFSVLAFHNRFFEQVRRSFVIGGYYPALTGACALGERILNHLILTLRDDFKGTPEYKKVYNKNSFDKWDLAIEVLKKWNVLLPEVVKDFGELQRMRTASIHFRPELDTNDRDLALNAIHCLQNIIKNQFAGFGSLPWIFIIPGEVYIKREWEKNPFIRKVYLKNCIYVGPKHRVMQMNPWRIDDDHPYTEKDILDEEFMELREKHKKT